MSGSLNLVVNTGDDAGLQPTDLELPGDKIGCNNFFALLIELFFLAF